MPAMSSLLPRGVEVVAVDSAGLLPFDDGSFEMVSSPHPVRPDWQEIARVLADGGTYLAQHMGAASAFVLVEYFLGPLPDNRRARDADDEAAAARAAGLEVVDLRTARCRMEFSDIGAVVHTLRRCVWWVPDFSVDRYRRTLRDLDADIRRDGAFVAHSNRTPDRRAPSAAVSAAPRNAGGPAARPRHGRSRIEEPQGDPPDLADRAGGRGLTTRER